MFGSMRIVLVLSGLLLGSSVAVLAQDRDDEGVVQTRGPIHEAFAQPLQPAPQAGPVIRRKPPEAVPELPAEQKPDGEVVWIPGYWSWDDERSDFIWVSGFWRQPPAGRRWVPGYWAEADDGWQWVPGFWAPADRQEVPYQPAPPQSLDYGPVTPSPGDNYVYSPGYWVYRQRYYWRPGSWIVPQNGNVWVPPSYSWTPNGCVFVDGYWDYPLEDRGLLFAPVAFDNSFGYSPGWYYRPNYAVGIAGLLASLFLRPGYNQYCYGDYYGSNYYNAGYRPWFGSGGYDPLYSYYNWSNRGDPGWRRGNRDLYAARNNGSAARPPRTLAQQNTSIRNNITNNVTQNNVNNGTIDGSNNLRMVTPLNQLARTQGARGRGLTSLSAAQLQEQRQTAQRLQEVARQRTQVERVAGSGGPSRNVGQARSLSLPPLASTALTPPAIPPAVVDPARRSGVSAASDRPNPANAAVTPSRAGEGTSSRSQPAKSTPTAVGKSPVQSPAVPRAQNPDPQRAENPIARPNPNAAPKLPASRTSQAATKSSPPVQAPAAAVAPQAAPRAPQPQPFRQVTPQAAPRVSAPPQQPARQVAPQAAPRVSTPPQQPARSVAPQAAPRVSAPPRQQPARSVAPQAAPRFSAPVQRQAAPVQRPAAAPRAAAPPRVSAPSRPAPAPRMSAPPQRSSPPAQRGGGGGGGNRQSGKKK